MALKLDPDPWRLGVRVQCLQIPVLGRSWQYVLHVQCGEHTRSSPGQLLATVRRVGVPPHERTQHPWPTSSRSEGQCTRCTAWSSVCCCRASVVDVLLCMDLGMTAHVVANVFMRYIKDRAENCERLTTRWVPTAMREVQTPRKADAGTAPQQSKGAATRHMASLTLELAARHSAGPSDRCVCGVVQALADHVCLC